MNSNSDNNLNNYISLSEASKVTGYHPDYLGFLSRSGKLKSFKFGRNWMTTKESIDEFIKTTKNVGFEPLHTPLNQSNIQVHVVSADPASPFIGELHENNSTAPAFVDPTIVPVASPSMHLENLKRNVFDTLESRVNELGKSIGTLETRVEKKQEVPLAVPIAVAAAADVPNRDLRNTFASNFSFAEAPKQAVAPIASLFGIEQSKKLLRSFTASQALQNKTVAAALLVATLGFTGSVAWSVFSNWSNKNNQPQETKIVYQEKGNNSNNSNGSGEASSTVVTNVYGGGIRNVTNILGPTQSELSILVDRELNNYAAAGKLKGEKGDMGPQGLPGSSSSLTQSGYNPFSFYQPVPQNNFAGGSAFTTTFLSAQEATIGLVNANDLKVSGSETFNGPAIFNSSASFNGTTTFANLSVGALNTGFSSGSVVFQDSTGLAQDNTNLFYDNATKRFSVGTNTPTSTLYVQGNASSSPFTVASSSGGTMLGLTQNGNVEINTANPLGDLSIKQINNGDTILYAQRKTDVSPSGDFINYTNAAGVTLFRVDNNGNVTGSGTASAGSQTFTSTSTPQLTIQYDALNQWSASTIPGGKTTFAFNGTSAPSAVFVSQINSVNTFSFQNAAANPVLSIDTLNQRVGINTSTPQTTFALLGRGTTDPFDIASSSSISFLHVTAQGNVGIGTTTPGAALTVIGSEVVSGSSTVQGNLLVAGNSNLNALQLSNITGSIQCLHVDVNGNISGTGSDCGAGSGSINGSGTNGYVTRFTASSTLANGIIIDNGIVAGVNASSSTFSFNVQGTGNLSPFNVASSTGASLFQIAANGSTTLTSLGTGVVRSNGGSLYNGLLGLTTDVSGILPVTNGGTNANTIGSAGSVAFSNGSSYSFTGAGAANQLLISQAAGTPIFQNLGSLLVAGTNILLTGTSTISIAATSTPTYTTINGLTLTPNVDGFSVAGGTTSRTLTVSGGNVALNNITVNGNNSTLTLFGNTSLNQNLTTTSSPAFSGLTINGAMNVTGASSLATTTTGQLTIANLSTGIVHSNGTGLLTSAAINLASGDITGIVPVVNGGTGTSTLGNLNLGNGLAFTAGDGSRILIGTSTTISLASNVITNVSTGTAGTIFNISTSTNAFVINLPIASASNTGQLSNTDYTNFINKIGNTYASSTFPTFSYASSTFVTSVNGAGNIISSGGLTPTLSFTGILPVTNGGTGAANLTSTDILFGNGTGAIATSSGLTFAANILTAPALTLTNLVGTQCLHEINGVVSGSGTDCGASGGSLSGGTTGYVATWASSTALTIGTLLDSGIVAGVNATSSTVSFNVRGSGTLNPFNVSSSTGVSLFTVLANGNIGIGTTTAGSQLTTTGNVQFSNFGTGIAHLNNVGQLSSSALALGSSDVSGILGVTNGGTGANVTTTAFNNLSPLTTKGDLVSFDGSNNVRLGVGANGLCLTASSTTASGLAWTNCASASGAISSLNGLTASSQTFATTTDPNITLTITSAGSVHTFTPGFTGQLSVARGGTGQATLTQNALLFGNGSSSIGTTTVGTNGQILIGVTASNPTFVTVSADASINNSGALTLATVNSNVGTFNTLTVNGKGLVTAASNTPYLTGNQAITLSGDVSGTGTTSIITTLANINSAVGAFGASNQTIIASVNSKGLIANISTSTIAIDASQINSGILAITRGGTNSTATPTAGGVSYGTGSAYAFTGAGAPFQILQSNGTGAPTFLNIASLLTGSSNIAISGTSTIAITGIIPVSNGGIGTSTLGNLALGSGLSFTSGDGKQIIIGTSTTISLASNVITNISTGTTGNIFNIATSTNSLTINLPFASTVNTGQLQSSDWLTFNNKLSGNGINGYVTRYTGASTTGTGILLDNGTVAGVNATSSTVSFNVQGSGILNPFNISSSTGTSLVRVLANGNVGIGTSTPASLLSLQSQSSSNVTLSIQAAAGQSANLSEWANSSGTVSTRISNDGGSVYSQNFVTQDDFTASLSQGGSAGLQFGSTSAIYWSNGNWYGTKDVGLSRLAAGSLKVTDGSTGLGSLAMNRASIGTTSTSSTLTLQSVGGINPLIVTSSTGSSLFTIAGNGSTTLSSLGTGIVRSSSGALYNGGISLGSSDVSGVLGISNGGTGISTVPTTNGQLLMASGTGYTVGNLVAGSNIIITTSTPGQITIAASGGISGSGTNGQVAYWTSLTALSSASSLLNNGAVVGINATSSTVSFNVQGSGILNPFNISSSTGTSLVRVLANGNVGIGTSTPRTSLDVQGNVDVGSPTATKGLVVFGSDSVDGTGIYSVDATEGTGSWLNSNSIEGVTVDASGIKNGYADMYINLLSNHNTYINGGGGSYIYIGGGATTTITSSYAGTAGPIILQGENAIGSNGSAGNLILAAGASTGNNKTSQILFQTATAGTSGPSLNTLTTKMVIIGNGNVGIGSTTPGSTLSVQGTSTFPTLPVLTIASSTGISLFTIAANGSTTIASLGTGIVRSNGGSLFAGGIGLGSSDVSGILGISNGGTGISTAPTTNGQLLMANGTGYTVGSLVAGTNITITTSTPGQIIIASTGSSSSLSGTGVNGFGTRWTASSTLGTGIILDNGSVAGVNATSSTVSFNIQGTGSLNPFNIASSTGTSLLTVFANGNVGIGTATSSYNLSFGPSTASTTIASERTITANTRGTDFILQGGGAAVGATNKAGGNLYLSAGLSTGSATNKIFFQTTGGGSAGTTDTNPTINMSLSNNALKLFSETTTGSGSFIVSSVSSAPSGIGIRVIGNGTARLQDWQNASSTSVARVLYDGTFESEGNINNAYGSIGQFQNLLLYSEQMNNAVWYDGTFGGTLSAVTPNSTTSPDGTLTANTISSNNSGDYLAQNVSTTTVGTYTFSVWLKATTTQAASLIINNDQNNLTSGITVGPVWSRYSATVTLTGPQTVITVGIGPKTVSNNGVVYAWGAQLVPGAVAQGYVKTTSSNINSDHGIITNSKIFVNGIAGIGTTTSSSLLTVQGSSGSTINLLTVASSTGTTLLSVASNGSTTITSLGAGCVNSTAGGSLFVTACGSGGGITGGTPGYDALFTSATTLGTGVILNSAAVAGINATSSIVSFNIQGTGILNPFNVSSSTGISLFRVSANGNIGIGTTTGNSLLTLQASAGTTNSLFNVASSSGASLLQITPYGAFVQNISSSTAVSIQDGNGNGVFNIDTTQAATNSGLDITAGASQTGNLLNILSSGGTQLAVFTSVGGFVQNISSTTSFQVQNGSGLSVFAVNTVSKVINIATTASSSIVSVVNTDGNFTIGDDGLTGTTDGRIWLKSNGTLFRFNSTGNTADYSEFFYHSSTSTPDVGTVIVADLATSSPVADAGLVTTASTSYSSNIIGVVTNKGTGFNNAEDTRQFNPHYINVGMLGHINVKVTNQNGPVHAGDYLTSSDVPGYAMKAIRSGYVIGMALSSSDAVATSATSSILTLVHPAFQLINNTFVLGTNDGQLAGQIGGSATSAPDSTFLIDQQGSGNLLQLQQNNMDKFVVNNNGAVQILSNATTTTDLLTVKTSGNTVFNINSLGDLAVTGHITVGKDSAGTATIKTGDNKVTITFATAYATIPKIVATVNGVPSFFYGVINKTGSGFDIVTNAAVTEDTSFDWVAVTQDQTGQTRSGQNLQVLSSPAAPTPTPTSTPDPTPSSAPTDTPPVTTPDPTPTPAPTVNNGGNTGTVVTPPTAAPDDSAPATTQPTADTGSSSATP